jgi:uncharacterized protein (DUF433 family)
MALSILPEVVPLETDADGVVCVSNTRVTLDTIVMAFKDGATAEEIAQQYTSVPLADVYTVLGYYLRKQSEVEAYLLERQEAAERAREENESRLDPAGLRDRLAARQQSEKK